MYEVSVMVPLIFGYLWGDRLTASQAHKRRAKTRPGYATSRLRRTINRFDNRHKALGGP